MEQFVFIVALLLIGIALQKMDAPADFSKSLNFFVIYVSLPATVLIQIPKVHLDLSALGVIAVPWLLLPIMAAIVIAMTRHYPLSVRAALLLVIPLGNTSFVGIPIIHTLLGEEAIPYVLMYDQFGTFLMLSLYGSAVIARFETGSFHKRLILEKTSDVPAVYLSYFCPYFWRDAIFRIPVHAASCFNIGSLGAGVGRVFDAIWRRTGLWDAFKSADSEISGDAVHCLWYADCNGDRAIGAENGGT